MIANCPTQLTAMNLILPQFVILLFLPLNFVKSNPIDSDKDAKLLNSDFTKDDDHNYKFAYDISNGIQRSEIGNFVDKGTENEHLKVHGFYSFVSPDGKRYIVSYTADENGFVPVIKIEDNAEDQSKVQNVLNEFPDNIGTALLATLNGG